MGQSQVSNQSGTSWYSVITASSYEVAVLIVSLINYVTHQYSKATYNTTHKTSPGEGLQYLIALFLVSIVCNSPHSWFFPLCVFLLCVIHPTDHNSHCVYFYCV